MTMVINGSGSITGLSAGGLPDASVTTADLASGVAVANIGTGGITATQLASDAVSYVKLLSTDWSNSKATSGYQKLPSGLIIQWGAYTSAAGNATVTFPISFPSACTFVGDMINYTTAIYSPVLVSKSTSNAVIFTYGSGTFTHQWIAVGY